MAGQHFLIKRRAKKRLLVTRKEFGLNAMTRHDHISSTLVVTSSVAHHANCQLAKLVVKIRLPCFEYDRKKPLLMSHILCWIFGVACVLLLTVYGLKRQHWTPVAPLTHADPGPHPGFIPPSRKQRQPLECHAGVCHILNLQ